MAEDIRKTTPLLKIIEATVAEPTASYWGFDLMRATGLASGTLYPLLARLENLKWLTSGWAEPEAPGKPARRYYKLTQYGTEQARITRAEAAARGRRVRLRELPRPVFGGVL
jgi:PadR family transcriptional regulator PadR